MYTEQVMDHFANPRNVGEIENADGIGEVGNAKCGDIMKMYIKVDNDIITDVKGKPIKEALELSNKAVVEALGGLPAHKIHCSVLAEQSIKAAIADYYTKQGIDPEPIVGKIPTCEDGHCH